MRAHKKMWIWLLASMVTCWAGISCKPSDTQTGVERSTTGSSEGQTEMKKADLSKEQITVIANRVARDHGRNLEKMVIRYDEGNAMWKAVSPAYTPDLPGQDYQAVAYFHERPTVEGGLWVLVHRKTGEVLKVIELP